MDKEKIIFELDVTDVLDRLQQVIKRIDSLKQKMGELGDAAQKGNAQAAKSFERLSAEMEDNEDALKKLNKTLGGYINTQAEGIDMAEGANDAFASTVDMLDALTAEYEKNGKATDELKKKTEGLKAALQQQDAATGNTTAKSKVFGDILKKNLLDIKAFGVSGKDVADKVKEVSGAFKLAGGGVKGFSAALATTGIPLVVSAVNMAVEAFSSLKPVMQFVEKITLGVGAAFKALITGGGMAEATGAAIAHYDAMNKLKDSQLSFDRAVQENTNSLNRYLEQSKDTSKSETERMDLLKQAENEEKKIMASRLQRIDEEQQAHQNLFTEAGRLTEEEINLLQRGDAAQQASVYAKLEAHGVEQEAIERYKELLLEKTKLEGEQLAQQQQAVNRYKELSNEINAQREREEQQERERRAKATAARKQYNDNLTKLEEEFVLTERERMVKSFTNKLNTIKGDSDREKKLRIEIIADMKAALQKLDDDAQKEKEARQKEASDTAIENEREQRRVEIELMEDSLLKRQRLFDLESEEEEEAMRKSGVIEEQITLWRGKRMKEIREQYQTEELNQQLAHANALEKLEMDKIDQSALSEEDKGREKIKIQLKYAEEYLRIAKQMADTDGERTQEEKDSIEALSSAIAGLKNELNMQSKSLKDLIGASPEELQDAISILNDVQKTISAINDAINASYSNRLRNIEETAAAEIAALDDTSEKTENRLTAKEKKIRAIERKAKQDAYEQELEQFKINKALSLVQAVISTASAVMNALATMPYPASIGFAAAAGVTGAIQIGVIAAQKPPAPPKFAQGVIGMRGPGTETSDSIPAYLSKGESVITAKATKRFAPVLAQMEMAVGNIPNYQYSKGHFADGVIGDGGFYTRESVNSVQNSTALREAIAQGFREAPTPVVSVQEITRVNTNVSRSVKVSEL